MRTTPTLLILFALAGSGLNAAIAADNKDSARSLEARKTCEKLGLAGDKQKLEDCCRNNVPTQARQADEDKYTAICMKGGGGKAAPKK